VELGISRTQLYRKLKALTDYSANRFIRIIRLQRAAQILKHGQNNIAEVMDATGFSNYSYFNNCFKEYFGEYPKDYALLESKGSLN
jgi:AraC-like DNA-binding protein